MNDIGQTECKVSLSNEALDDLRLAKTLLENPSLAVKLIRFVGVPIEKSLDMLPSRWSGALQNVTIGALRCALRFAVISMGHNRKQQPSISFHKSLVAITGGVGGAFGLPALVVELPMSTIAILRSIADIAISEGEDIKDAEARLACLEVFAFGGQTGQDDSAETGYFAVRAALARSVSEAAKYVAEKGLADKGAPAIVRLIAQIASRFNVVVSQKLAAQAIPMIGAASGITINTVFIDHFQKMARGHFIIRRLERTYHRQLIREVYDRIS